jgi:hypothetical protein
MTAAQAKEAQASGVTIIGSDFVLHKVSVKIVKEQVTPTPTPSGEQTTVWSSDFVVSGDHYYFGTGLTGVQRDKAATVVIYGHKAANSWDVKILYDWNDIILVNTGTHSEYGHWDSINGASDGYVSIPLSATDVNNILTGGLRVGIWNWTTSRIEIKQ